MKSRILLAFVVLGAIIAWARCSYTPPALGTPAPNGFFLGCFTGAISDVAITGRITLVFEPPADSSDQLTLNGCMRTEIQPQPPALASLSGTVLATREEALVTATPAGGGAPFALQILRDPAGDNNANEIEVNNAGGAPFQQAANLPRCNPQVTCPLMVASMQPEPEPVLELP